jgi:hypothetical protein
MTWHVNATLVHVYNATYNVLVNELSNANFTWIGLTRETPYSAESRVFVWMDTQSPLSVADNDTEYEPWRTGEPNDYNFTARYGYGEQEENCVITYNGSYVWNDIPCEYEARVDWPTTVVCQANLTNTIIFGQFTDVALSALSAVSAVLLTSPAIEAITDTTTTVLSTSMSVRTASTSTTSATTEKP